MALLGLVSEAESFYGAARIATGARQINRARSAATTFARVPSVEAAWNLGGTIVGVPGVNIFVGKLVKYGVKLALNSGKVDEAAAVEMVSLMKSRVPVDTGNLLNGISYENSGGDITVTASAIKENSGVDYARFVEFGTHGNGAVADDSFFADGSDAGTPLRRSSRRGHGATPAQPFFWNSAREVLAKRGQQLEDVVTQTKSETGW